jgi:transposase
MKDQIIVDAVHGKKGVVVRVRTKETFLKCSNCGSRRVSRKGCSRRTFLTTPIGCDSVRLAAQIQRLKCKDCGTIRQERLSYADPKKSYTRRLEKYINKLLTGMTKQDVARNLGMSWNTIREIQIRREGMKKRARLGVRKR